MGCGGSRLGGVAAARAEQGGVVPLPAGIRPLLRRRLEEMKKRSHASVLKGDQTLSKKELLRHGSSEDGEETEENDVDSLKSSAKVAPAPDHQVEEKKEVVYEKVPSINDVKEVKEEEEVVKKQEEEEVVKKQEEENHDVDVDVAVVDVNKEGDDAINQELVISTLMKQEDGGADEGRMSNFNERMLCHGSPSFRVYCVDIPSDDDDDEEEKKDVEDTRKSVETESVIIEPKEEESIVKKDQKRERKGKRFALPRKYLANVTAPCYVGGGCMGNNTHSRLVQEKSVQ